MENGVRFIQVVSSLPKAVATDRLDWDAHDGLAENHAEMARLVDKPIAGLLRDLKSKGLLDSTLVVWTSEFGRTSWGNLVATTTPGATPSGWPGVASSRLHLRRDR